MKINPQPWHSADKEDQEKQRPDQEISFSAHGVSQMVFWLGNNLRLVGIGSIKARRWIRALLLAFAWS
jgi:hypothetical protein